MVRLVPFSLLLLLGFGCAGPAFETATEDDARAPDAATPVSTARTVRATPVALELDAEAE